MTSTNDGKDVKSNQTSAPKGKSHYIELYKSLEARLSEVSDSSERTRHLCEGWSQVHTLCLHSAQSTQSHLLSWLQRHTARTILQTEWQSPKRKEDRARLESAIDGFISKCNEAAKKRDTLPWEAQLVARGEWFKKVLDRPWDHPVLNLLLNPNGTPPTDDEVLKWLKEERGVTFVMRLHALVGEKCDDIAVSLASAVMERVRSSTVVTPDLLQVDETKDKPIASPVSSFGDMLTTEAGFTVDVWELLTDIEFVLLHKLDSSRCISLAKQTPLRSAYQLVERLQSRLELSPREKRLWKNAKDVAVLIAQVVIARCMVVPVCAGAARGALYCCGKSLARALGPRLAPVAAALAAPAASAKHLHTLAQAVDAHVAQKNDTKMKPFVCELYVRAITAGMNELERLKLKTEKESEARQMEKTLCQWFMQLGNVLNASDRVLYECMLTAFSVHPSVQMYEKIREAPHLPSIEQIEPKVESKSEFGSWAGDSRSQTNFVKTSETLNMKAQQQANVLSTAIFNEGEALGLNPELCQDIAVLLSGPRVKTLTWDMDREQLIEHCRIYMERTHGGTRALTTELKFLNLDPQQFMHLPEEEDDEDDIYYGIEKGYEHLVPIQSPDDMWDDPNDPERTESANSPVEELITPRRKKKTKPLSSDDEVDPLSLVAENKRNEKKKERPHSKERSKERKKKEPHEIREPKEKKDKSKPKKDKPEKEKKERKKKEKALKKESLNNLIGLTVANKDRIEIESNKYRISDDTVAPLGNIMSSISDSDYDSQGKSSMTSMNSVENSDVLFDGLFSMDELKSPERPSQSHSMGLMKDNELSVSNGKVGVHHPSQTKELGDQRKSIAMDFLNQPPLNSVREEVKRSLNKLIDYRRQRATLEQKTSQLSPHSSRSNFDNTKDYVSRQNPVKILNNSLLASEAKLGNAISRPKTPMHTCISPKGVAIPDIPKSFINKQQSEKLAQLKREIDNILATRKHPHSSSYMQSPVIQYAQKSVNDPSKSFLPEPNVHPPGPTQHQNQIRMKDLVTVGQERCGPYEVTKPVFAQSRPRLPVHRPPITETPGEHSYKKFLAEFQRSVDTSPMTPHFNKKEIKPVSRVTAVVTNVKNTPQRAKQMPQQKKPDNSLNTFSRLSYMHKNKQADIKNKASEASNDINIPRQSLGSKIDDFVWDHLRRSSHNQSSTYSAPKVLNEYAQSVRKAEVTGRPSSHNTILGQILGHTDSKSATNLTCGRVNTQKPITKSNPDSPPKSYLSEQDQADLIKLLRQQNTFSVPASQPSKQHIHNTAAQTRPGLVGNKSDDSKISKKTPSNKVINVISSTIIKPPSNSSSANNNKPHIIFKKGVKGEVMETPKKTESKPDTKKNNESDSEWQSVCAALLAQKTPSRGPNALDVALNKSSFEKAFEDSLRRNHNVVIPEINEDRQLSKSHASQLQDDTIKSDTDSKNIKSKSKKISITKSIEQNKDSNASSNHTKDLAITNANEMTNVVQKKSMNVELPKKYRKENLKKKITYVKPTDNDPFISGIPNSDYDLIEELMDDDLRKEIDELSSDEESYCAPPANMLKSTKANDKRVTVVYNKQPINTRSQPVKPIEEHHQTLKQVECLRKPSMKCVYENKDVQRQSKPQITPICHKTAETSSIITAAPNEAEHNPQIHGYSNARTYAGSHLSNNSNIYVSAAVPHSPAQSVVLIGSNIVYEGYSTVQTPLHTVTNTAYVVNSVPNMTLYQPTQYVQPVINPAIINNTGRPLVSNVQYASISAESNNVSNLLNQELNHQNINNGIQVSRPMNMSQQTNKSYETNVKKESTHSNLSGHTIEQNSLLHPSATRTCFLKESTMISNNNLPKTHSAPVQLKINKLSEHMTTGSSKLGYKDESEYNDKIIQNIALENQFKQDNMMTNLCEHTALNENHIKQDNKISEITCNKNIDRKVLSEVQEKQILTQEKLVTPEISETKVKYQSIDYEKPIKTCQDQERLTKKRMAIINRKISHYSEETPIPLSYSPLCPAIQEIALESEIEIKTKTAIGDVSSLKPTSQKTENVKPDNCKENKSSVTPCRRILLRSSNKLQSKSTCEFKPTPQKVTEKRTQTQQLNQNEIDNIIIQKDEDKLVTPKRNSKRIRNKELNKNQQPEKQQKSRKVKSNVGRKASLKMKFKKVPRNKVKETKTIESAAAVVDIEAELLGSKILKTCLPEFKIDDSETFPNENIKVEEMASLLTEMENSELKLLSNQSHTKNEEMASIVTEIENNEQEPLSNQSNSKDEEMASIVTKMENNELKPLSNQSNREDEEMGSIVTKMENNQQELLSNQSNSKDEEMASIVTKMENNELKPLSNQSNSEDEEMTSIVTKENNQQELLSNQSNSNNEEVALIVTKMENSEQKPLSNQSNSKDEEMVSILTEMDINELKLLTDQSNGRDKEMDSILTEIEINELKLLYDQSDNDVKELSSTPIPIPGKSECVSNISLSAPNANEISYPTYGTVHTQSKETELAANKVSKSLVGKQESDVTQLSLQVTNDFGNDVRNGSNTAINLKPKAADTSSHLLENQENDKSDIYEPIKNYQNETFNSEEISITSLDGPIQNDQNLYHKNEIFYSEKISKPSEIKDSSVSSENKDKNVNMQEKAQITRDTGDNDNMKSLINTEFEKCTTDESETIPDMTSPLPLIMSVDDDVEIIDDTKKLEDPNFKEKSSTDASPIILDINLPLPSVTSIDDDVKIIDDTDNFEDQKSNSDNIRLSDIPQSYKDSIIIEHLPKQSSDNPLKKCVRIKLPNGRVFKATVYGDANVNFDTLLHQPSIKSALLNNLNSKKRYTLNIKQVSQTQEKPRFPRVHPGKVIDTVNLLSDDEYEDQQVFDTEFGKYKIQTIETDSYKKHHDKLKLRSVVVLEKQVIVQNRRAKNNPEVVNAIDLICKEKFEELKLGLVSEKIIQPENNEAEVVESALTDVVLIDDSSDDEINKKDTPDKDINTLKENLLKDLGVGITKSKDETVILKENLLADLGINIATGSKDNDKSKMQIENPVINKSIKPISIEIPEIDLTEDYTEDPKMPTNPKKGVECQLMNFTRECRVKLVRCDELVKMTKFIQENPMEQIVEAKLDCPKPKSRSNSFSILDDFPLLSNVDAPFIDSDRSSPVLEVFDFIATHENFVGQQSKANEKDNEHTLVSVTCSVDWLETKQTIHALGKNICTASSFSNKIDTSINTTLFAKLPSLTFLALKYLQDSDIMSILKPIGEAKVFKTLKRKLETSHILTTPKISKSTVMTDGYFDMCNDSDITDSHSIDTSITNVLTTASIETIDDIRTIINDLLNDCICSVVLDCKTDVCENIDSKCHDVEYTSVFPRNTKHQVEKILNEENISDNPEHQTDDSKYIAENVANLELMTNNADINQLEVNCERDQYQDGKQDIPLFTKLNANDSNDLTENYAMQESLSNNPEQDTEDGNYIAESDTMQASISNSRRRDSENSNDVAEHDETQASISNNPEQDTKDGNDTDQNNAIQASISENLKQDVKDGNNIAENDAIQTPISRYPDQGSESGTDTSENDEMHDPISNDPKQSTHQDGNSIAENCGIQDSISNDLEQNIEDGNDIAKNDGMQKSISKNRGLDTEHDFAENYRLQESMSNKSEHDNEHCNDIAENDAMRMSISNNLEHDNEDSNEIAVNNAMQEFITNESKHDTEDNNDMVENDTTQELILNETEQIEINFEPYQHEDGQPKELPIETKINEYDGGNAMATNHEITQESLSNETVTEPMKLNCKRDQHKNKVQEELQPIKLNDERKKPEEGPQELIHVHTRINQNYNTTPSILSSALHRLNREIINDCSVKNDMVISSNIKDKTNVGDSADMNEDDTKYKLGLETEPGVGAENIPDKLNDTNIVINTNESNLTNQCFEIRESKVKDLKPEEASSTVPHDSTELADKYSTDIEGNSSIDVKIKTTVISSVSSPTKSKVINDQENSNHNVDVALKWEMPIANADQTINDPLESNTERIITKILQLTGKEGSEVILKGVQYEDPQVGTCYMFPLIEETDQSDPCGVNLKIPNRDEIINLIRETSDENLNETDDMTDNFDIIVPTHTYTRQNESTHVQRNLKRKKNMSDVKVQEKRYRKGKNIDYPKFTKASMNETVYCKEYKRLIEYCSTVKFSYSRPFHKESIEVDDMLQNWPIDKAAENITIEPFDIQGALFTEIEEQNTSVVDPLEQTLAQEITSEYNESDYKPINIVETNFSMGFGERSDRVIHYTKTKKYTSKLSAATLSDVKPYQPFLTSGINSKEMKNVDTEQNDKNVKLRHVKFIEMREKVRSFFRKTAAELVNDVANDSKKYQDTDNFPFGLTSTEFLTQVPQEILVNVVQVGQLPVSAAAQNPVTCDPRVTHVTNVSPSQCSAEHSSEDDNQTPIKTEYTELTTADITLPLVQEYAHHLQQLSNCQETPQTQETHSNNCGSTEIKAQIKIELTEESSQERFEAEEYEQLIAASDNNNINNGAYNYHEISNSTTSAILDTMNGQNFHNNIAVPDAMNGHNPNNSTIVNATNGQNLNTIIKKEIDEFGPDNTILENATNSQHINNTSMDGAINCHINNSLPVNNEDDRMKRQVHNNTTVEHPQTNDQSLNLTNSEVSMNVQITNGDINVQNTDNNTSVQTEMNAQNVIHPSAANSLNGQGPNNTNTVDPKNVQTHNTTVEEASKCQSSNNIIAGDVSNVQSAVNDPKDSITFSKINCDQTVNKTDQLAHAMNAAGITPSSDVINTSDADALVDIISQNAQSDVVSTTQMATNNFNKSTPINAMALQQALAQILPPPLNQTSVSDNGQTTTNPPPVLHIVQGSNSQTVINKQNGTPILHIVQNKAATNGAPTSQANSFTGLSLVDTGLQQGGNQLLHIVNTGNQKNNNTGHLLKRVNLLTNIANVQGGNEQKMVQFVCKSADGKSIQLNAPHQRSMVLRLQPIDPSTIQTAPKPTDPQDVSPNTGNSSNNKDASQQDIKSRSVYEENYAKFIQNGTDKPGQEKATSLPKFNQVFGKQVYQENKKEMNSDGLSEHTDGQQTENNVHLDGINDINSPPLLLRKSPSQTSQAQTNLVQQIKQTIAPMNIQTMHGGVIYTRQIPVNIGGGQTINLITVPSTELVDDSNQKQQSDGKFIHQEGDHVIKIVPQSQSNNVSNEENNAHVSGSNETPQNPQPQPVLTQMRIKLPMLSKTPHMVSGARVVRPSFFQIQRNVIGGANQPVYQQLVLTTAPSLGQTIRVPTQTRPTKPPDSQSSPESQMSSSTLEQLREFDMVLEQVKERSTVNPGSSHSFSNNHSSADTTDKTAVRSKSVTETTQVTYTTENNQTITSYVNRKSTITSASTSSFVRSPDSSGIVESPSSSTQNQIPQASTSESTSSETPPQPKPKKKKKSSASTSNSAIKMPPATPKPSSQKPQEDEQTTQRILYILAEYKEQVENSPDKDKPAPRRRNNLPPNLGKRKKSSSGSRRRDMSPIHGEDSCRTMGSEDSSCGTSLGECSECMESHSPEESPRKVVRKLTFEQESTHITTQTRTTTIPQRNVIVADGQTFTVARGTAGKPATTVLMPANYLLPVSMVKGGQQIAIVTNRGPKLLVGGGEGGTGGTLLLQRLIGPGGLKPVLTRPGVRHIRLPTAALHNLQAFNIATHATTTQPADSTASPAPAPAPPDLVDTRAMSSPWPDREAQEAKPDRGSSPEGSEPWNLPSSSIADDYGYEEIVRTDNMDRTVLDAIPDRYSPDMEAQRIFDKMFDVDSKKSMYDTRCGYDIDASDTDDRPYQVVQRRDGRHHRLTHVSAAALRHKYAILEHELRLQKSLSEECEDLGVDSPSAAELFPEAELFFAPSPVHEQTIGPCHTPQPTIVNQGISQPDLDDQIATDHLLTHHDPELDINLDDVGEMVTVGEDGMTTIPLDHEEFARSHEEFARSHPNTTFHTEPEEGEIPPFTISQSIKGRQITFHAGRAPGTVVMAPQTTVISQATVEATGTQNTVKFTDIDNIINAMPTPQQPTNMPSVVVKDSGLTRFDSILTDSREVHLSNTASAIVHSTGQGTQVIRRVRYDDRREPRYMVDDPDPMMEEKLDDNRDLESMAGDETSSPERHPELFWESNSTSERSEGRRRLDCSSDSDKCCKSPFDEASTDSSFGNHTRLDSVIKAARTDRSGSGSSDDHPPLRTYPPKRVHVHPHDAERSLTGKTRAGESCLDIEGRRRASNRGVVKRGCHCCNGSSSPAPPKPKKSRQKKPSTDFTSP